MALVVAGAAAAVVALVPPVVGSWYPPCVLHQLTGLYCPGCGGTRSAYLLFHGDFAGALRDNALFIVLLPIILWFFVCVIRAAVKGVWEPPRMGGKKGSWATAACIITFAVVRNIPTVPFTYLAPEPLRLEQPVGK